MKYILVAIVLIVTGYFIFNQSSSYPNSIEFDGQTFLNPIDQNDSLSDMNLLLYKSKTSNNYLMIGKINNQDVGVDYLFELYVNIFKQQNGYSINRDTGKVIGNKADSTVYLTKSNTYDGVAAYIDASDGRLKTIDESFEMYYELSDIEL
ncbi:hypothetical protein [Marinicellulosiphila megalodicopiae]|uniref:hypothetical protein n=1 Tax=Marinicellulosiphila megalodicopiae TaxID=2724896 RepID=UPI003BB0BD09